jgi:Na+-translocating ferredoxin:NAD+ oxidoreductase RnfD subunit
MDMLFGNRPGAIGEIAVGFLILGSIGLLAAGVIRWEIPVAALGALAALSWIFGGLMGSKGLFSGDALLSLLCGSAFMASFFCATDPVTSPSRTGPRIAYGALVGALIFLFRTARTGGDATAFAVISANVAVPLLERATGSRRARRRG